MVVVYGVKGFSTGVVGDDGPVEGGFKRVFDLGARH